MDNQVKIILTHVLIKNIINETSYSSDPAVLQSKINSFSILAVMRIHCIVFRSGVKSRLSVSRACKCHSYMFLFINVRHS